MAELDTSGGGGKKGGKVRSKKQSTRIDLTAMVDLAFLLVTFFMLTTTLSKPKAMDLAMPDKDEKNPKEQLPVKASQTLTVLLGSNNKLEWFMGVPGESLTPPTVDNYGKDGIRKVLVEQSAKVKQTTGKDILVLVKPSEKSVYKNVVDMLDELHITNITAYAIVDITPEEIGLLKRDNIF
ncbi:ExbD/TolR family protein [Mucilaginibacter lacusdianchii]|uniref:ExbD/TolR family protein n=1 Tax=Mucilaginibacter lacusdianchii TaxID=2684211 RepID=UPI00131BB9A5|nr:biopolymer transporter ExbD [Mucilaginibacter sp. JXJ CY 39]